LCRNCWKLRQSHIHRLYRENNFQYPIEDDSLWKRVDLPRFLDTKEAEIWKTLSTLRCVGRFWTPTVSRSSSGSFSRGSSWSLSGDYGWDRDCETCGTATNAADLAPAIVFGVVGSAGSAASIATAYWARKALRLPHRDIEAQDPTAQPTAAAPDPTTQTSGGSAILIQNTGTSPALQESNAAINTQTPVALSPSANPLPSSSSRTPSTSSWAKFIRSIPYSRRQNSSLRDANPKDTDIAREIPSLQLEDSVSIESYHTALEQIVEDESDTARTDGQPTEAETLARVERD